MTAEELAQILEDRRVLGELSEADYKDLRFRLLKGLRQVGGPIPRFSGTLVQAEVADSRGHSFCYVSDGPFLFGPENDVEQAPLPFYMAKYPVTVSDFEMFVADTGYDYGAEALAKLRHSSPTPDCPVTNVGWNDARQYCRWLRRCTHEYYHLPNEQEWERAARGDDGRPYPWGDDGENLREVAWFDAPEDKRQAVSVTAYPGNISPSGCVGMVGNVWEWCSDALEDPADAHMMRGGSYLNSIEHVNTLVRSYDFPATRRLGFVGFRTMYLPRDMLAEHKRQREAAAGSGGLSLVRHSQSENATAIATGLSLDPAAVAAAAEQQSESVQELAQEIGRLLVELKKSAVQNRGTGTGIAPIAREVVPPEQGARIKVKKLRGKGARYTYHLATDSADTELSVHELMHRTAEKTVLPDDTTHDTADETHVDITPTRRGGGDDDWPEVPGDTPAAVLTALVAWTVLFIVVLYTIIDRLRIAL